MPRAKSALEELLVELAEWLVAIDNPVPARAIKDVLAALEAAETARDEAQAEVARLRQALDSTNTTGQCDGCGKAIESSAEYPLYCACTPKRPCSHRQWRTRIDADNCPVCAALEPPK